MGVYVCKSTDTGAPTLNGTAGALITVLDALLVNGYNSKTITITRSGATATANCTSHGFNAMQTVLISGADQAEYNGEFKILAITDANNFTFTVSGSPATPATGTITCVVAPLGWTKTYSGTNKAAYRQKSGTNQFYLRVDDSNAQNSQFRGYEAMTDVDTGTGPFPTTAQFALGSGLYFYKSITADATARTWKFWSNGKIFYFQGVHGTSAPRSNFIGFGDFHSYLAGDVYNTIVLGEVTASNVSASSFTTLSSSMANTRTGAYIPRNYANTAGAILVHIGSTDYNSGGATQISVGNMTYPNPISGGAVLHRIRIGETAVASARGLLPGLWTLAHSKPFNDGDTFSGAAGTDMAGMSFEYSNAYNSTSGGAPVFETTSLSWDSIDG
jgi:hypothetical protein